MVHFMFFTPGLCVGNFFPNFCHSWEGTSSTKLNGGDGSKDSELKSTRTMFCAMAQIRLDLFPE